ncbi:unnamed protein product [Laminaria digitata]
MTNYRPCNKFLRIASGAELPIEGRGNLVVDFQSGQGSVRQVLYNVAYVPSLSYHLFSLPACVGQGHTYVGDSTGITVNFKSGDSLLVPLVGDMYFSYGYRLDDDDEVACAVISPGLQSNVGIDINDYNRSTAHNHPQLLRKSAEQQNVKLKKGSKLVGCAGCSAMKGFSKPIMKTTHCRSDKRLGRFFCDLSGKKGREIQGGQAVLYHLP